MASEMEEALEAAEEQANELTKQLVATSKVLEDIVDNAKEVDEKVKSETADLQTTLKELSDRLDAVEGEIKTAREAATSQLESAGKKAEGAKGELGDLLAKVKESMTELEKTKTDIEKSLDTQYDAAAKDFEELHEQITQYDTLVTKGLGEGKKAIADCRQAIDDAQKALGQKYQGWVEATNKLSDAATEQANAWVKAAQELLDAHAKAIVDAGNGMLEAHNKSMETLKTKFDSEADQELANALKPLEQKIEALGQKATARKGELGTKAQGILDAIQALLPEIQKAIEQMETTKQL